MPFEARDLPSVIWVGEEAVAGPFCRHCGYPLSMHGDDMACRLLPNLLLPPNCACHRIELVTRTIKRRTISRLEIVPTTTTRSA